MLNANTNPENLIKIKDNFFVNIVLYFCEINRNRTYLKPLISRRNCFTSMFPKEESLKCPHFNFTGNYK